jgi:uncharacterized protein involved in exopolysaccharide biosynthesis
MTVVGERMVRITARDVSPAGAAALAGAWAGAFAQHVEALVSRDLRQRLAALNELDERINGARRALGAAEQALWDFQARSRIPLLQQRVEETVRRIALYEVRLVEIEQGGGPILGDMAVSPGGERFTLLVIVDRNPAKIRRVLVALKTGLPSLQAQLAAERRRETQVLRRVEQARGTYERLVAKREELVIIVGTATGLVSVAVAPAVPDAPVAPQKAVIIILAAILGLLAGVVLAFVIEYFAPSVDAAMTRPIT